MDGDVLNAARRNPLFAALPAEEIVWLLKDAALTGFQEGELVIRQDAPGDAFHLIVSGHVALFLDHESRGAMILDLLGVGSAIGEEVVLEGGTYLASARAQRGTRTLAVGREPFRRHLESRFDLMQAMLATLSGRLRGLVQEITELKLKSTTERLAGYLVSLSDAHHPHQEGAVVVTLPCDKHRLAERLGMQPESLSRAFARLREHGVSSDRHDRVQIADLARLRLFCQADPLH